MDVIDTDPSDYIAAIDDPTVRATMVALDALISEALTDRCRVLWHGTFWGGTEQTIIGYGHITQPRPRGDDVDWFLAGLARQKRNYSIYLNAVEEGRYLAHAFADRLGKVKLGAASIGFTTLDHIDQDAFTALLTRADDLTPPDPAS